MTCRNGSASLIRKNLMPTQNFWHVTAAQNTQDILASGFIPGWGDAGCGVYVFDDPVAAQTYADNGGWDGHLVDAVIIQIETDPDDLIHVEINPQWPNPEDYEHVLWYPMDDDGDEFWQPTRSLLER